MKGGRDTPPPIPLSFSPFRLLSYFRFLWPLLGGGQGGWGEGSEMGYGRDRGRHSLSLVNDNHDKVICTNVISDVVSLF